MDVVCAIVLLILYAQRTFLAEIFQYYKYFKNLQNVDGAFKIFEIMIKNEEHTIMNLNVPHNLIIKINAKCKKLAAISE